MFHCQFCPYRSVKQDTLTNHVLQRHNKLKWSFQKSISSFQSFSWKVFFFLEIVNHLSNNLGLFRKIISNGKPRKLADWYSAGIIYYKCWWIFYKQSKYKMSLFISSKFGVGNTIEQYTNAQTYIIRISLKRHISSSTFSWFQMLHCKYWFCVERGLRNT